MVKRIIDTSFWTDMEVIDNYSVEDKFFYLYLLTNDKTTQVGIYPLPIKVMSFETGFTTDVIQVLIERFSDAYKKIIYSKSTQEITLLESLEFSVLTGGKPVSDLLERELSKVRDTSLIKDTYSYMTNYWKMSKRKFDQTIMELFENEMSARGVFQKQNQKQKHSQNDKHKHNHSNNQNQNHNQESYTTSRDTSREELEVDSNETRLLGHYIKLINQTAPYPNKSISPQNILYEFYTTKIGEMTPSISVTLELWEKEFPRSIILEALNRSIEAQSPISYANKIIEDWKNNGVKNFSDIVEVDRKFNRKNYELF